MAAFDLNSLYFLKNAAPKTVDFHDAVAPMERGFNLGRAYNDSYNKNSLQNLIAQREQEGIPFDRLSNEAAKYDLGAANGMRQERRSSLEYNYRQGVAEFEQWRKNMARRICGLILQKADELAIPQEQYDQVLNTAASYVMTYDPDLARYLMQQSLTRRNNVDRNNRPQKEEKDHELQINATIDKMMNLTDKDLQSNPRGWAEDMIRGHAGMALHRFKAATGTPIWARQMAALANIAQQRFPGWEKAGREETNAIAWLDGLDANAINELIGNVATPEQEPETETATTPATAAAPAPAASAAPKSATSVGNGAFNIPLYRTDASGKKSPYNLDKLQQAIDNAENEDYLKSIRTALQKAAPYWTKNDNDANQYNSFMKQIEDKIKSVSAPVSEKIKAKFDAGMTGEQRTALSTQRNSFTTALTNYNNGTYMAAIGPILRASNPQERSTDQDVMRALQGQDANTYSKVANLFAGAGFKNVSESFLRENAGVLVHQLMLPLLEKQRLSFRQQLERVDFDKLSEGEKTEVLKYLSDQYGMPVSTMAKYFEIPGYPKPKKVPWLAPDKNAENVKKILDEARGKSAPAKYTEADWDNF